MGKNKDFEPASKCTYSDLCKMYGVCWGATLIRSRLDTGISNCNHKEADEAREYVNNLLDLNKPLPPQT